MKESKAWEIIAQRVALRGRTSGLCIEVMYLQEEGLISQAREDAMDRRVEEDLHGRTFFEGTSYDFLMSPVSERAEVRVLMALLYACEARDDEAAR